MNSLNPTELTLKEMGALVYQFHEKYPETYDCLWVEKNMKVIYQKAIDRQNAKVN